MVAATAFQVLSGTYRGWAVSMSGWCLDHTTTRSFSSGRRSGDFGTGLVSEVREAKAHHLRNPLCQRYLRDENKAVSDTLWTTE